MKWHCGILGSDEIRPNVAGCHAKCQWTRAELPDDHRRELAIWLAMPGFSTSYHAHNLGMSWNTVRRYQSLSPGYDQLQAEVAENWLSVTREDAVQLCRRRPDKGDIPVICQLKMLDELKAGRSLSAVAREFGVSREWLVRMRASGIRCNRLRLPKGFEMLLHYPCANA